MKYRARDTQYQTTFRVSDQFELFEIANAIEAFLNALSAFRTPDWSVTGCEFSGKGQDFFVPVTDIPLPSVGTAQPGSNAFRANYMSFTGKSAINNPARIFLYGVTANPLQASDGVQTDYRIDATESAGVPLALVALQASGVFVASDDNPVVAWNQYANIGLNSYRQRKIRRG